MLDSRIKLRHLSCFLEVSVQRSFGKAAERLNLSQPAVSKAIAELEQILGNSLLQRSRSGVFLPPAGEAFRRYAETGMAALREGFESIGQTARGEGGFLALGALPTVATRLVPAALLLAKREGLHATVRVLTGPNDYLLGLLNGGQLDIVVGRLSEPKLMQGLSFEPLYTDEVAFGRGAEGRRGVSFCVHPQPDQLLAGLAQDGKRRVVDRIVMPGHGQDFLQRELASFFLECDLFGGQVKTEHGGYLR